MTRALLAALVLLALAACERREGAARGPYVGGGAGLDTLR